MTKREKQVLGVVKISFLLNYILETIGYLISTEGALLKKKLEKKSCVVKKKIYFINFKIFKQIF